MSTKAERVFQSESVQRIKERYGHLLIACYKSSHYAPQGWPDYEFIFFNGKHAYIEYKKEEKAADRPNQDYWRQELRAGGNFTAKLYPENETQVMMDLEDWVNEQLIAAAEQ